MRQSDTDTNGRNLRFVLVADPGQPSEMARDLTPRLPEDLRRRIARGTMMGNRYVVEKDTKSLAGERDLPLPALVGGPQGIPGSPSRGEARSGGGVHGVGLRPGARGGPRLHDQATSPTRVPAHELLGLRRVRPHDARSSCFTFLANNGVPDHILARWAGHTNVKTTKKWYVKPDVEDLRGAATTWDGLHGGAAEGQE
ncbi:tyrosine-type recombinase/integrase [Streptomyces mirabilis]|uniref:tyrosine-type recombinase/integrase n=1 Tax=Streptomyces mirabilis TaxID=68239 RepID=UPI0036ECF0BB